MDDDVDAGQMRQPVRPGQEAVLEGEGDMPLHPVHQQRPGGRRAGLGEAGEQPVGRGVGDRGVPYGHGEADRRPAVLGGRHGQAGVLFDARPEHPMAGHSGAGTTVLLTPVRPSASRGTSRAAAWSAPLSAGAGRHRAVPR